MSQDEIKIRLSEIQQEIIILTVEKETLDKVIRNYKI